MKILLLLLLSAETTPPKSKEVIAIGSCATNFDWNEDLTKHSIVKNGYIIQTELYRQTEGQVRTDLNIILTVSGDVDSATVEITDFSEIPGAFAPAPGISVKSLVLVQRLKSISKQSWEFLIL